MIDPPASKRTSRQASPNSTVQFLRFAAVGAAGTLLHYLVLSALVLFSLSSPGTAAGAGACLGACVNYWLNHQFTFASSRQHRETLPRFFMVAAVGVVANGLIVAQFSAAGMHFLIAQVIATLLILVSNFLISKKWIFHKAK